MMIKNNTEVVCLVYAGSPVAMEFEKNEISIIDYNNDNDVFSEVTNVQR